MRKKIPGYVLWILYLIFGYCVWALPVAYPWWNKCVTFILGLLLFVIWHVSILLIQVIKRLENLIYLVNTTDGMIKILAKVDDTGDIEAILGKHLKGESSECLNPEK